MTVIRKFTVAKKLAAVREILAGRKSLSETARALSVQHYQLQAWIGQMCGDSPQAAYEALRERFERATGQRPSELEELTHGGGADEYLSPPPPAARRRR